MRNRVEIPARELPVQITASSGQPVRNCELQVVFDDGASIDLLGNVEPLLDDNGRPQGAVSVFSDVTERKRAEGALRDNEQRLVSIYNTVRDIIFHLAVEPEGQFRFVSVNAAFHKVTGLTPEMVVGKTVNEVIPEPSLTIVLEKYRQAVEEKTIVLWEETSDYPTGRLTGEISVAPVLDQNGVCTHLVGSVHDITGRKRAEAERRESEERFRNLADTAPVLIWVAGPDKLCTFFNKPWLDFTGRAMEQELGNGWTTAVHPDDLDRCLATYSSAFGDRRSFHMEYRLRRADGVFRWLLDTGIPRYRGGEFIGFIGSCIDVTEQKLVEERLRASELRLMDAQRLAKVGSWEMDLEGERIHWSDEMFRIYGLTGAPPANLADLLTHVHPKDQDVFLRTGQQLHANRAPVEMEYRVIRPDGEVRFLRSILQAVRNEQGAPVRIVGSTQDITGQVLASELLRQNEERLKNAERIAHIGNWRWDVKGGRVFWSEELLRILGDPEVLAPGYDRFLQLVVAKDKERVDRWVKDCIAGKSDNSLEFQIARPTGDLRTVVSIIEISRDEEGRPATISGTCQDITESRRAQDEAFARQKLESVGRLASGIAHDFNNLLGAVLAQADLALAELPAGSPCEEELERIRDAAMQGAGIVRQLMIYAGKEKEAPERVDLSQIVREMLGLFSLSISKNSVLETALGDQLPSVVANPSQLRQIVMNLVTNASQAIGERNGTIRVTTAREILGRAAAELKGVAEGDYISLEVSDSGCGMPPEIQAKVFDPFFTTKPAGHGLGLAVVLGIVRNLSGAIDLTSEPGRGTTFHVLLPAVQAEAGAAAEPVWRAADVGHASQGGTVLVVEDEHRLRQAIAKLLRKSGFQVLEAGDGTTAIELLHANSSEIDIILLDMTIPGRSSQDVVAEASQTPRGVKVIVTSAYSAETVMPTMRGPLVRGFIRKPFRHGEIVEMLRTALSS
jgi:PAS domain S-box-containing protein